MLERNRVKKKIKAKKVKHIKSSKGATLLEPVSVSSAPATDAKESSQKEDVVLAPEQKHVSAENIVWEGDVPAGHLIESTGGSVTINGKVGKGATVKSKYGLTINGDAEEKSILIAQNGVITLKHACDGVSIKSPNLFVKLQSVGNGVNIETDDDVRVEQNIDGHCTISSGRRVSAKTIGTHTVIKGKLGVTADVILENTVISANEGKVNVRRVEECSTIFARYDVTIEEFAAESAYIEAGDRGNVLLNGKFRVNSPLAIANHIAISAGFELGKAVKNLSLGISSDKAATPADAKVKASPSISESGADSKMNPKKEIDRPHYNSKPFLTTNLSYITAEGGIRNIRAHFYELLGQLGAISNNIKTKIPFDMQHVLEVTWGDVKKSILLGDCPSVCDMNFYEEDFGNKTRIIKTATSASVDKAERYVQSASISQSVISSSQPSYLEQPAQNYYFSSLPMMFSSREVKREEKGVLPRPLKLPTAVDLNKILGISGLVTEVREVKSEYIHDSMSISFDMGFNTDLYEHILSEKLLASISGVKLTKCSVFTRLNIPDDVETYNKFMLNIESALKQVNESTTRLKMGNY